MLDDFEFEALEEILMDRDSGLEDREVLALFGVYARAVRRAQA